MTIEISLIRHSSFGPLRISLRVPTCPIKQEVAVIVRAW